MDNHIATRLREVLKAAGLHVRGEYHRNGLSVEFTTSPPLTWTYAQCDNATKNILDAPLARPDKFGCHPEGQTPGAIGEHFSTDHDRIHSYWRFRLETYPGNIVLAT